MLLYMAVSRWIENVIVKGDVMKFRQTLTFFVFTIIYYGQFPGISIKHKYYCVCCEYVCSASSKRRKGRGIFLTCGLHCSEYCITPVLVLTVAFVCISCIRAVSLINNKIIDLLIEQMTDCKFSDETKKTQSTRSLSIICTC